MPHLPPPSPCHKICLAADGHVGPVALGHDLPSVPRARAVPLSSPTCSIRVPTDAEQAGKHAPRLAQRHPGPPSRRGLHGYSTMLLYPGYLAPQDRHSQFTGPPAVSPPAEACLGQRRRPSRCPGFESPGQARLIVPNPASRRRPRPPCRPWSGPRPPANFKFRVSQRRTSGMGTAIQDPLAASKSSNMPETLKLITATRAESKHRINQIRRRANSRLECRRTNHES